MRRWLRLGGALENRQEKRKSMKLSSITRFLEQRRLYWNVINELSGHSDRDLQDLGISRADIAQIAQQASRG
jgi:uncharacterized protein YjiS (DUF1127 family)